MRRRTRTQTGAVSQTTTTTRDGKASTYPIQPGRDHQVWCECFMAAISGTAAAQRSAPNPEMIVRWSEQIADRAEEVCRRRKS